MEAFNKQLEMLVIHFSSPGYLWMYMLLPYLEGSPDHFKVQIHLLV